MTDSFPVLSVLIWLPIFGGVMVWAVGDDQAAAAKRLALGFTVATLAAALALVGAWDFATATMQFVEKVAWIPPLNAHYHLGVDGVSMPLIVLTAFFMPLVVLASWDVIQHRVSQYLGAFLLMEGVMIGVFCALDAVLFYVFWEAMLIPMFLIIGVWGGPNRVYATIKFFLYTFLGSVFMLVALIYLYFQTGSFDILDFHALKMSLNVQILIFLAFLAAFAVKIPMFPVHTWLPDAHVEAPTAGSVILAAIMLKMGGYGFLRFSLPIAPDASGHLDGLMIALSLIAVVYIGFVALAQTDMKKLVAYSSIAHMGFVTLGFFLAFGIVRATGATDGAVMGMAGGMVQMISHGFISGALFLCIGVMYDRLHSRRIADYGGVVHVMPWFAGLMVLFGMANSGLPGTSGFVGEFMVILAAFKANIWIALLAATTLILGAAFTLWMIKRVLFGPIRDSHRATVGELQDINAREGWVLGILAFMVVLFGVWPQPMIDVMQPTIEHLVQHVMQSKLP